ncbi:helix-turn-helix domain-containing protein [Sinomicrobium sp. M5D2P9]
MKNKLTPTEYLFYLLEEVLKEIRELQSPREDKNDYLDNADMLQFLKVSYSTLRRMRKNKEIPYMKIGKKYYYSRKKIEKMLGSED